MKRRSNRRKRCRLVAVVNVNTTLRQFLFTTLLLLFILLRFYIRTKYIYCTVAYTHLLTSSNLKRRLHIKDLTSNLRPSKDIVGRDFDSALISGQKTSLIVLHWFKFREREKSVIWPRFTQKNCHVPLH